MRVTVRMDGEQEKEGQEKVAKIGGKSRGARTSYLLQCCVFEISLTQELQFNEKSGLTRWPLLGKNLRRFLRKRSFAQRLVAAVSTPS